MDIARRLFQRQACRKWSLPILPLVHVQAIRDNIEMMKRWNNEGK